MIFHSVDIAPFPSCRTPITIMLHQKPMRASLGLESMNSAQTIQQHRSCYRTVKHSPRPLVEESLGNLFQFSDHDTTSVASLEAVKELRRLSQQSRRDDHS